MVNLRHHIEMLKQDLIRKQRRWLQAMQLEGWTFSSTSTFTTCQFAGSHSLCRVVAHYQDWTCNLSLSTADDRSLLHAARNVLITSRATLWVYIQKVRQSIWVDQFRLTWYFHLFIMQHTVGHPNHPEMQVSLPLRMNVLLDAHHCATY